MHELFDLVSGSETGAIVASILALPNKNTTVEQQNMYFASQAEKWFEVYYNKFYDISYYPIFRIVLQMTMCLVFVGSVYIKYESDASQKFNTGKFDELVWQLQFLLKLHKKDAFEADQNKKECTFL